MKYVIEVFGRVSGEMEKGQLRDGCPFCRFKLLTDAALYKVTAFGHWAKAAWDIWPFYDSIEAKIYCKKVDAKTYKLQEYRFLEEGKRHWVDYLVGMYGGIKEYERLRAAKRADDNWRAFVWSRAVEDYYKEIQ